MIFESRSQKGLQNDQKGITFIDKMHMAFRHVENPYKTNENKVSQKPKTRCENPYETCRKWTLLEPKK